MGGSSRVERIELGSQGLEVSAQGLGCMGMSAFYGPPKPDEDMISLIHHAIHTGVTFLDTSDIYGPFTNEILLGKALKGGVREKVELATKFGISFADGKREIRGDPAYVRAACEASLKRLNIDCIDLYYQHRVDTRVPIEVTIGELKKLVEEGKMKYIGLSEASASTIRRAHAVHPITAVQLEWSLWSRDVEEEIIPTCRELGIGIVAYSPLGRGFFSSGSKVLENLTDDDFRKLLIPPKLALTFSISLEPYRTIVEVNLASQTTFSTLCGVNHSMAKGSLFERMDSDPNPDQDSMVLEADKNKIIDRDGSGSDLKRSRRDDECCLEIEVEEANSALHNNKNDQLTAVRTVK